MDEQLLRAAAGWIWDEATYNADHAEGRMWAARESEKRGAPLEREAAIDEMVRRVCALAALYERTA